MKLSTSFILFSLYSLLGMAIAQTLGPSPTESIGCKPHGDHWDCEGPRSTGTRTGTSVSTTTSPVHDDHDDDDHSTLMPSPTESYGCKPHGNHWHCEGHVSQLASITTTMSNVTTTGTGNETIPTTTQSEESGARSMSVFVGIPAVIAAIGAVGLLQY